MLAPINSVAFLVESPFFVKSFVARPTASQLPMWGIASHLLYHGCGVPVNPTRGAGSSVQNVNVSVGQCTGAMSGGGAHNRAWIHPQVPAGTAPQTLYPTLCKTRIALFFPSTWPHILGLRPTCTIKLTKRRRLPRPTTSPRGIAIRVRPV